MPLSIGILLEVPRIMYAGIIFCGKWLAPAVRIIPADRAPLPKI